MVHGAGARARPARPAAGRRRRGRRGSRRAPPRCRRRGSRSRARPRAGRGSRPGRRNRRAAKSKPWSACSAGTSGWSAISGSSSDARDAELVLEALRVAEAQHVSVALGVHALRGQAIGPEGDRLRRGHAPADAVHHAGARAARRGAGVLEEREVGAGAALLVGVEQVVDGRVVLVDRLLHQPQAEHPRVEVEVLRGVAGDRGDVVDAFELHRLRPLPG